MKKILFTLLLITFGISITFAQEQKFGIVIHGGAGVILKKNMSDEQEKAYQEALDEALKRGYEILEKGGKSEDAVIAAIMYMENSPLFNAGKGAVFTNQKQCELDASIMLGDNQDAGAVAGVTTVKNPILAAKEVMYNSPHVMLAGEGADIFAKERGLETVDNDYFKTERREKSLERAMEKEKEKKDTGYIGNAEQEGNFKYGTVGAVALDKEGNIAAATSTGGMTNKKWGRIGDAPVIGAGTYANNATCGISATGHGEYFIRSGVAQDVSARMEYLKEDINKAAYEVIFNRMGKLGGTGGVIGLDREGNVTMTFNTSGMYRGFQLSDGTKAIKIYGEEK